MFCGCPVARPLALQRVAAAWHQNSVEPPGPSSCCIASLPTIHCHCSLRSPAINAGSSSCRSLKAFPLAIHRLQIHIEQQHRHGRSRQLAGLPDECGQPGRASCARDSIQGALCRYVPPAGSRLSHGNSVEPLQGGAGGQAAHPASGWACPNTPPPAVCAVCTEPVAQDATPTPGTTRGARGSALKRGSTTGAPHSHPVLSCVADSLALVIESSTCPCSLC